MIVIQPNIRLIDITGRDIVDLLQNDPDEDTFYDFKEGIESTDDKQKHQMRKTAASFANTFGGFLFIGILDKANRERKTGVHRIVGVANTEEFGKRFTSKYLGNGLCVPAVHFEGPMIIKANSVDIVVLKFPPSNVKPHAIKLAPDRTFEFWERGSGTATPMDYSFICTQLESSREQRSWLYVLLRDIDILMYNITCFIRKSQNGKGMFFCPKHTNDSIICTNFPDLLRMFAVDKVLVTKIYNLKTNITNVNLLCDFECDQISKGSLPKKTDENSRTIASLWEEAIKRLKDLDEYLTTNYPPARELKAADTRRLHIPRNKGG